MTMNNNGSLSRGDIGALIVFSIAGVGIAIYMAVVSIIRILELARGADVQVLVEFAGDPVDLPLADGRSIAVGLETATITAPSLPPIASVPGIIGQVLQIVTVVVVIGCLIVLARSVLGGRIFSRRHTALVSTAGITGLLGFAGVRFFDNMLAHATVAQIADNGVDNALISVEPLTFVLAAFVVALTSTIFTIGDRLQRETVGLV